MTEPMRMPTRLRRGALALLAGCAMLACAGLAATGARAACMPAMFGANTIAIEQFELVSRASGRETDRVELPIIGAGARCLAMRAFPDAGLLFIEWHEGSPGTATIVHRESLLAFAAGDGGLKPLRQWLLRSGQQGRAGTVRESDRSYRLVPTADGVRVEVNGPEIEHVDGR